jgi:4-aminobutyrate aminotransferase-like enzyme
MEYLFKTVVEPQEVAAIFIEPIQAHGGVIVPPNEYFLKMKKICSEFGILIIDDEVVTGFGRTGRMFGIQHFGMEPDVMYFGKPIAAGMPLGAILARKELMDNWVSHGPASTLAANLLSCARASALIDILQQEKLVQNAAKTGTYFLGRMKELAERFPIIGDVRGKGLLIGIELVKNAKTKEPAQNALKSILQDSFKKGLLFSVSGLYKNVIKFSPPLILTTDQVDKAIDIIEYSLKQLPKCH